MKNYILFLLVFLIASCSTHQRSNVKANEEFVVTLKKPTSRGLFVDVALQGMFLGVNYFSEKSAKSLTSTYSQSISVNDYYNYSTNLGHFVKSYNQIRIQKYAKPTVEVKKNEIKSTIENEFAYLNKSRGETNHLSMTEIERNEENDLLNFDAKIDLISDPYNVGVTRLSFSELRILFSKTKIFKDENLNAKVSLSIEGQWRGEDGEPKKSIIFTQEYDFKNLKYSLENQIKNPIISPWYYDIPVNVEQGNTSNFGILNITVQVVEYEGKKSNYVNKLPSLLKDNKLSIINGGATILNKL